MRRPGVLREWREAPPYFLVVSCTTMMLVTGISILVPVLPGYASSFGVGATEAGMVVGAFAVGRLLFGVAGGALADRFGFRGVCVTGCVITGSASLVAGFTEAFDVLLVARLVQGMGSALYMNAAMALIIGILPEGKAGRWMSAYQGIFLLGLAVGPVIGGLVAEVFGLRAPFHAYTLMSLVGLVLSVTMLPRKDQAERLRAAADESQAPPSFGRAEAVRRLLRHPAFGISMLVIIAMFVVRAGLRNTAIPLYAEEILFMSSGGIGLLVTVAAIGQLSAMWHAGTALDRWGRKPVVAGSLFVAATVVLLFALAGTPWLLFVCMALLGLVTAYSTAAPTVILVDIADRRVRGTAVGIQRMANDFAQLIGPVVIGLTLDHAGYYWMFVLTAVLVLCAAVIALLWLPETRPRPGPVSAGHPVVSAKRR